jgi:hypothetical protein
MSDWLGKWLNEWARAKTDRQRWMNRPVALYTRSNAHSCGAACYLKRNFVTYKALFKSVVQFWLGLISSRS